MAIAPAKPAVPVDQLLYWYGQEIGRTRTSTQNAVSRGQMKPQTRDLILRNQEAVYQSLKRLQALEAANSNQEPL